MWLFHRNSLVIKSHAKINLALKITGCRDDAYHYLDAITLPLDLHDVVEVTRLRNNNQTYVTTDDVMLNAIKINLCAKAVEAMREEFAFKDHFNIHIHKNIPFAAGLGGGSSNAAAVMEAINSLLDLNASEEKLKEISLKIGTDLPFFFHNKASRIKGVGESITTITPKKEYYCLLIKPKMGVSTVECYKRHKLEDCFSNIDIDKLENGLINGDDDAIAESMGNDLLIPAESIVPEISLVLDKFKELGFKMYGMSGSGSCCFALTDDEKFAKRAYSSIDSDKGYAVRLTKTLNK